MTYEQARTILFTKTMRHRDALAAYNEMRDPIAAEVRGSKDSLNEADKHTVQQRMWDQHSDLVFALEVAEREKIVAEFDFDLADNAAKDRRREMDAATADKWMQIAQLQLDAATRQLEAARANEITY